MDNELTSKIVLVQNTLKEIKMDVMRDPPKRNSICVMYYDMSYESLVNDLDFCGISWTGWPKYSGNFWYPVPLGDLNPQTVFYKIELNDFWEGRYGSNRMELLDWLIEQLEKKLCE